MTKISIFKNQIILRTGGLGFEFFSCRMSLIKPKKYCDENKMYCH